MHIYAFGSVCRGEVTPGSDIDLLAITDGHDARFDPNTYSIYSYSRLREIWTEGNPFAWHLSLESKMLHSDDGSDYLKQLACPGPYSTAGRDCRKFASLFIAARCALVDGTNSAIFELSTIFLSIRNFATCFSLGYASTPDFSRSSALRLGENSIQLNLDAYSILERARVLCTRGAGDVLSEDEVRLAVMHLDVIDNWMTSLLEMAEQA